MQPPLFVTGMLRSGTTLLDKLLSAMPGVYVASQPLPLLYVDVKREFLRSRPNGPSSCGDFPLADMFGTTWYPIADFVTFLKAFQMSPAFCQRSLEEMMSFSGQQSRPERPLDLVPSIATGLFEFSCGYLRSLVPSSATLIGSKETYCEEYIPYLLECGAKVILVVRDPRDVVTSLNYGRGREFGGVPRPLMLTLRQWRKSVGFALTVDADPQFLRIGYEQLVLEPDATLVRICRFLDLPASAAGVATQSLRTADGDVWQSNSSHSASERITAQSVGRYAEFLPPEMDQFIQAMCWPEMRAVGYTTDLPLGDVDATLTNFTEREPLYRPSLAEYRFSPKRAVEEQERWNSLTTGTVDERQFISETSFALLQRAMS